MRRHWWSVARLTEGLSGHWTPGNRDRSDQRDPPPTHTALIGVYTPIKGGRSRYYGWAAGIPPAHFGAVVCGGEPWPCGWKVSRKYDGVGMAKEAREGERREGGRGDFEGDATPA
jgi:hypothetical protein